MNTVLEENTRVNIHNVSISICDMFNDLAANCVIFLRKYQMAVLISLKVQIQRRLIGKHLFSFTIFLQFSKMIIMRNPSSLLNLKN